MSKAIITIVIIVVVAGLGYWVYQLTSTPKETPNLEQGLEEELRETIPSASEDAEPQATTSISSIEATTGDSFSVDLDANPTTGYQWELDFDSEYLQLLNRKYVPRATETDLVGAGGTDTFNFRALKPGDTEMTFSYLRPWEKDKAPIEQKIYEITIK